MDGIYITCSGLTSRTWRRRPSAILEPRYRVRVTLHLQKFHRHQSEGKDKTFYITFVYGEPDQIQRRRVWDEIREQVWNRAEPWLLTGDFNDIIDASEKKGGPPRAEGSFVDFRTFMSIGMRSVRSEVLGELSIVARTKKQSPS